MRLYLPRPSLRSFFEAVRHLWTHEDNSHMKKIAFRYAERAHMDGNVIKKTGEIIPKESV